MKEIFSPEDALRLFRNSRLQAGAIVSFTGQVRGGANGDDVVSLSLEHYPGFTEGKIAEIANEAATRWPLRGLTIIHRVGEMKPGEAIVFVATAADHRRAAFEAADFLMDYLKSEAPFWKRETTQKGEEWIEPHMQDQADKARWIKTS